MKVAAVITEYNPFHNGHLYQLETIRQRGFSTVESSINSYKPQKCGIFLSNFIFLYVACVACLWYNGLEVIMIEALF